MTLCWAAGDPFKVIEPPDARLLMTLRVAGRGVRAAAVHSLSFVPASGADAPDDCLLVFGGQGESEPDMLTLLPLSAQSDGEGGGRQVPWFGSVKGLCTVSGLLPAWGVKPYAVKQPVCLAVWGCSITSLLCMPLLHLRLVQAPHSSIKLIPLHLPPCLISTADARPRRPVCL
jgi:hypothetical protein